MEYNTSWKRWTIIGLLFTFLLVGERGDTNASIPITSVDPSSTLLPPGTTEITFLVHSAQATTCTYAMYNPLAYDQMSPFDQSEGTKHQTVITGLDPDPNVVNRIYLRCASQPEIVHELIYRARADANPPFPRTGNLWGWWGLADHGLAFLARQDLLLGADGITAEQIAQLRALNPHILILPAINAVENNDVPGDDYFLKDVNGNKIEVWPGSYRLNLTKPYVAAYQAHYAYQTLLDTGLMADGIFFDNVFTTQSWLTHDIYGRPVHIDADEDGLPDDPAALDATWKAGVFHEIQTFRALAPNAIVLGHAMDIHERGIADLFNGISIGFWTADVLQGEKSFGDLWTFYGDWMKKAKDPSLTMIESSPLDEIAYGYDYEPRQGKVPSSTLEFARTYYPWMRFGLALTLMGDGYFAHEFGDTWHGNDWWYDELDFYLGYPLGSAARVNLGSPPPENLIENGDFEEPIEYPWDFWANAETGCVASVTRDSTDAAVGAASARIGVIATCGVDRHIEFRQFERALQQGVTYDVTFWAKSDVPRTITLSAQKGSPGWDNYGLWQQVAIDTAWQPYTATFEANATVNDSRIQFMVVETTGTVWLDDVHLTVHPPDVYRREFSHGLVLLNATREAQSIHIGPGYRRLTGNQAPLYETILDDGGPFFSVTGEWTTCTYDSGRWQASGPFYHDWGGGCHKSSESGGEARWELPITAMDVYTLTAWWPAAPEAVNWSANATYEVVANGQVIVSATLDQRTGGNEWHFIAAVQLSLDNDPFVRLTCAGSAPCIADALHLRSWARYNDGSRAEVITLQPMDGIILEREWAYNTFLPFVVRAEAD